MCDVEALLFDFDGVMTDSEPLHRCAWEETMRAFGSSYPSQRAAEFVGMPDDLVAASLVSRVSLATAPDRLLDMKRKVFLSYIGKEMRMYDGLRNLLYLLTGKTMGIVTSSVASIVLPALDSFGVADLFQTVVCADDVLRHKPAPDPYLLAAERLGVAANRCVVIEDSRHGIVSGKAAGMFVIGVTTTVGPKELEGADVILPSTSEAVQWMLNKGIFERE